MILAVAGEEADRGFSVPEADDVGDAQHQTALAFVRAQNRA
jgi:hypothetical protein